MSNAPQQKTRSIFWYRVLATALVLGLAAVPARAQDEAVLDTLVLALDPIEVTATPFQITTAAAPFAVSHLTRSDAELNRTPALSLSRLTYAVPGLWINQREHYATGERVTLRGLGWRAQFGVRGLQVILDGIPLTLADGQSVLDVVDPGFVREVEVLRGPASTFWGNASGGVLALSTRPPGEAAHQVRARQLLGSYGLAKTDLQVTPALERHQVSAYASYLTQDGFREHSDVRLGRAGLTGHVLLGPGSGLRFFGAYAHMPRADSPGSLPRELVETDPRQARAAFQETEAGKSSDQGQFGAAYYRDVGIGRFETAVYGLFRDLENPLPFAYIQLDRRAGGLRATLEGEASFLDWGFGLEGKLQRDDRLEVDNAAGEPGDVAQTDQLEEVYNQALFARASVPLGRLRLGAGLRYDWLRFEADDRLSATRSGARTFQALSPSVGLLVDLEAAQAYANLSTALEAPTTTELGNRPDGQGGFNPDVDPEHTLGLETGVRGRWARAGLTYDLAVFALRVRDLLLPFQLEADGPTFFRNEGETRHAGLETAVTWLLPSDVSLAASYTYTRARFEEARTLDGLELDGNRIPGVPRHLVGGSVDWRPDPLWVTLEYEGASTFYVDSENTTENAGYAVLNLRLSHAGLRLGERTRLTPSFSVNNVLDERYNGSVIVNAFGGRYFEPAAGRHWQVGLALQLD